MKKIATFCVKNSLFWSFKKTAWKNWFCRDLEDVFALMGHSRKFDWINFLQRYNIHHPFSSTQISEKQAVKKWWILTHKWYDFGDEMQTIPPEFGG